MATPRARWSKVGTEILGVTWTREQKLRAVLLQAYLSERWVDKDRDAAEGRATLSEGVLRDITGLKRFRSGFEAILELSGLVGATVSEQNGYVSVHWPNYANLLIAPARNPGKARATSRPQDARSVDVAVEALSQERTLEREPVAAVAAPAPAQPDLPLVTERKPARQRKPKRERTPAPDAICAVDRAELEDWCRRKYVRLLPRLDEMIETCLDHHRANGSLMALWPAAVRKWIANESTYEARSTRGRSGTITPIRGRAQIYGSDEINWFADKRGSDAS